MRKSQEAKENQMREGQTNDEGKWGNIDDPNLGKIVMRELFDCLLLKMT